jgi:NAD(P)-dependent dehydrogenase (short-subunit alcohol dehydrogenase family)
MATAIAGKGLVTAINQVGALGRRALAIPADLSDPRTPESIVGQTLSRFESIDILVNNAGVGSAPSPRPLLEFDLEARLTPLGRRLEPEEVVPLALLLASDESAGITGQAINVCGGALMV